MTHNEKLIHLVQWLINEKPQYSDILIPTNIAEQKKLLRSLLNVRSPMKISSEFLAVQDEYLREEIVSDYDGRLTLADVHAALSYYYANQDEIDGYLSAHRAAREQASE